MSKNNNFTFANYAIMTLDGALFMGGLNFLAAQTLMPKMVQSLGGPVWLIMVMPMMMRIGFVWPPLFIAHHIERMSVMKKYILIMGVFQRIPFLIAGLSLFFLYDKYPLFVVFIVAFAPFISGFMGGLSLSAWFELLTKVVDENKRTSLLASRFILSSIIGLFAGGVVYETLRLFPGVIGYGILHIITFIFLTCSFLIITFVKEHPDHSKKFQPKTKLKKNLKELPVLLKNNRSLSIAMYANLLVILAQTIAIPFIGIYAQKKLGMTESFLGSLTTALMLGGVIGNIGTLYLGKSYKNVKIAQFGAFLLFLSLFLIFLANSSLLFYIIFFLLGAGIFISLVGMDALVMKISPENKRPTCIAFYVTSTFPIMILGVLICSIIANFASKMMIATIISLILLVITIALLGNVKEKTYRAL